MDAIHEVTFDLTWQEYATAQLDCPVVKPPRRVRPKLSIAGQVGPVIFALGAVGTSYAFPQLVQILLPYLIGALIGVVGGFLFLKMSRKHFVRRAARQLYESGDLERIHGLRTLQINAAGLTMTTAHGVSRMSWSGIVEIAERRGLLFLFLSSKIAYIVPRRAFADGQAFERFASAARAFRAAAGGEEILDVLPASTEADTHIRGGDHRW